MPVVSTLPYTRLVYQRMFLDQLQYLTDPDAHKFFREQEQRMKRETWERGTVELPASQLEALIALGKDLGIQVPPSFT